MVSWRSGPSSLDPCPPCSSRLYVPLNPSSPPLTLFLLFSCPLLPALGAAWCHPLRAGRGHSHLLLAAGERRYPPHRAPYANFLLTLFEPTPCSSCLSQPDPILSHPPSQATAPFASHPFLMVALPRFPLFKRMMVPSRRCSSSSPRPEPLVPAFSSPRRPTCTSRSGT